MFIFTVLSSSRAKMGILTTCVRAFVLSVFEECIDTLTMYRLLLDDPIMHRTTHDIIHITSEVFDTAYIEIYIIHISFSKLSFSATFFLRYLAKFQNDVGRFSDTVFPNQIQSFYWAIFKRCWILENWLSGFLQSQDHYFLILECF